jgi:hypothetical protein
MLVVLMGLCNNNIISNLYFTLLKAIEIGNAF